MESLYKRFNELTGHNNSDMANRFNLSRQYIHQLKRATSITYRLAFHMMLTVMLEEEIKESIQYTHKLIDYKDELINELGGKNNE